MSTSFSKLALRSDLHVHSTPQGVVIVGERDSHTFVGLAFAVVADLLDGTRSESELVNEAEASLSLAETFYVLGQFRTAGLLVDRGVAAPAVHPFWDALATSAPSAGASLHLRALDGIEITPLARALSNLDLAICEDRARADLRVVVAGHYLDPELAAINHDALRSKQVWMLVRPTGRRFWIGPRFAPGETACWACLAQRLRLNSQVEDFLAHNSTIPPLTRTAGESGLTRAIAADLTAKEIAHVLVTPERFANRILTLDWRERRSEWHNVTRRPQCSECGDPAIAKLPRRVDAESAPKVPGEHRSASAEQTASRFRHLVSPITGVVSWLTPSAGEVHGLSYNVSSGHNFRMGNDTLDWLKRSVQVLTGGKGGSRAAAQASALGEAIERYSAVFRGEEATRAATFIELGEAAVHPDFYVHFSASQYAERASWNAAQRENSFNIVSNPFRDDVAIDWVPVWSPTLQDFRYFPASYCYFGHSDSSRHFFFGGDTNGCAAGVTSSEAFTQAFYELVERDAVALWWYNRALRPGVDIDSFLSPTWPRLKAYYASLGRAVWALDLTADLGIPSFAALSARIDHPVEDIIFGFAAHLDASEALSRAIGELNQFLPAVTRQRDGVTQYNWPEAEAVRWWTRATRSSEPYLLPAPGIPLRRRDDFSCLAQGDVASDMETCITLAKSCGLEVFALDLTRPDIGMNVCRVIVPGLRHFWRRLAPGRLYDMPVTLSWIDRRLGEHELNHYSIFL